MNSFARLDLRVNEVANLVKSHITSKPEVDKCATEREQLMKIREEKLKMKERHQEEERDWEGVFALNFSCFDNMVKEAAGLVKPHIIWKTEVGKCEIDFEREQLMGIYEEKQEMTKMHQEEELELEKQFTAALKCFVDKATTIYSDSDPSYDL